MSLQHTFMTSMIKMDAAQKAFTLQAVETKIQYQFQNLELLWEALHAAGAIPTYDMHGHDILLEKGNKRLALVGGVIARSALTSKWFWKSSALEDGSKLWTHNLSNDNLAERATALDLELYILKQPGLKTKARQTLADTMEAILGAVWEDSHDIDNVFEVLQALGLVEGLDEMQATGPQRDYDPDMPLPKIKNTIKNEIKEKEKMAKEAANPKPEIISGPEPESATTSFDSGKTDEESTASTSGSFATADSSPPAESPLASSPCQADNTLSMAKSSFTEDLISALRTSDVKSSLPVLDDSTSSLEDSMASRSPSEQDEPKYYDSDGIKCASPSGMDG